jgi:tetratricopeptide (TPR) repeat protein
MRRFAFLCGWLFAVTVFGATPEVGKDALRKLVKLPSITFDSTWAFDAERGFSIGSSEHDLATQISALRKQLKGDPSDAESQLRLGELQSRLTDIYSAGKSFNVAAELFRRRIETQGPDAMLLCGLGRALQGAGRSEEAESVLRKAVGIAPKEWRCRVALGRFLDSSAHQNILTGSDHGKLLPGKVALSRRQLSEADECFDKAASLAPEEGEVYFRRGMHRSLEAMLLNQIDLAQGELRRDVLASRSQFSAVALADLQHASRLRAKDYALIGNTVLFEIYNVTARQDRMNWNDFSWNSLPEKTQHSILNAETRLENLGQDFDSRVAGGALEVLGILQGPILRDSRNCVVTLHRTVVLDPSREQAWDILSSALAQAHRYDELLSICQERVREKESSRAHLLLGKAFEKMHQWDEAEAEILESVRLAPNSFTANLAEAALVLRRGQDADMLMDANSWLARAERLLGELPATQRNQQTIIELTLTRSIYFALTDQLDAARQWANAVLSQDKNNPVAQQILSAMDY